MIAVLTSPNSGFSKILNSFMFHTCLSDIRLIINGIEAVKAYRFRVANTIYAADTHVPFLEGEFFVFRVVEDVTPAQNRLPTDPSPGASF